MSANLYLRLGATLTGVCGTILYGIQTRQVKNTAHNSSGQKFHPQQLKDQDKIIQKMLDELNLWSTSGSIRYNDREVKKVDCVGAGIFHDDITVTQRCHHLKQSLKQLLKYERSSMN